MSEQQAGAVEPQAQAQAQGFDPARHLSNMNGRDYLEVKWRLVWLRREHPNATIHTHLVSMTDTQAVFKATVALPAGGVGEGYGSETVGDFRDYMEKAETKAIGRALAVLGYGTQFAADMDDEVSGQRRPRPVDAPVERQRQPQQQRPQQRQQPPPRPPRPKPAPQQQGQGQPPQHDRPSAAQRAELADLTEQLGMRSEDVRGLASELVGRTKGLTSAEMQYVLDYLRRHLKERQQADADDGPPRQGTLHEQPDPEFDTAGDLTEVQVAMRNAGDQEALMAVMAYATELGIANHEVIQRDYRQHWQRINGTQAGA